MDITLHTDSQVTAKLSPKLPNGKPAKLDGTPEWTEVGDADLVTLTPSDDGLSCLIRSNGTPGITGVTVSADADLGAGVTTITAMLTITLSDPQASSLGLEVSAEEPIPEEAP